MEHSNVLMHIFISGLAPTVRAASAAPPSLSRPSRSPPPSRYSF